MPTFEQAFNDAENAAASVARAASSPSSLAKPTLGPGRLIWGIPVQYAKSIAALLQTLPFLDESWAIGEENAGA